MGRLNLLEMSPVLKEGLKFEENGDDSVLVVPRNSWLERLSVRLWDQPAALRVELDALGSLVLRKCAGQNTVAEIERDLASVFGEQAEPVLPRLVKFLEIVEANGWIGYQGGNSVK